MSGEILAAADIATGAIVGSVVESELSAAEKTRSAQSLDENCLNCGAPLRAPFCGQCGQKSRVHRTLAAFWHDLVHSVFHFDGKIWRTLPMLVLHPGELTRRYVHGERAKFVSPLALFLFTMFLMFAVYNSIMPSADALDTPSDPATAAAEFAEQRSAITADIKKLEAERTTALSRNADVAWMDREIARNREELERVNSEQKDAKATEIASSRMAMEKRLADSRAARLEAEIATAEKAGKDISDLQDKLEAERISAKAMTAASDFVKNGPVFSIKGKNKIEIGWLVEALNHASENPKLLLYKVQSNAYKYAWALIPLSVPFVWLMFAWRRQFKMFDHAVFVTYSLCFMMMLFTVSAILMQFESGAVAGGLALCFIPPVHMYKQIKYAYGTSRLGAFARASFLIFVSFTVLTIFGLLILVLGVL